MAGVSTRAVRDLFKQARALSRKEGAPCIICIDEFEVLGATRMSEAKGGQRDNQQALTELLVQMDGFQAESASSGASAATEFKRRRSERKTKTGSVFRDSLRAFTQI